VKDEPAFPYIKYGNQGFQYEGLRDERITPEQELEKQYGTKYYEFKQIQGVKKDTESEPEKPKNEIPDYVDISCYYYE
jgi:hypothetical protein